MNPVEIQRGDSPLVLGLPHTGTYVPEDIFERLTPLGKTLSDTDWHIEKLYDGLLPDVDDGSRDFPSLCDRRQPRSFRCQSLSRDKTPPALFR